MSFSYFQFMKSAAFLIGVLILSNGFSQKIIESKLLPCKGEIGSNIYRDRIISQTRFGDSLLLEIGFIANCAVEFSPVLTSKSDTLFLELTNVSEAYAMCDCCYNMLFYILDTTDYSSHKLFVNQKEFKLSKSRYIDFPTNEKISRKLLKNETNAQGLKVGYWGHKTKHGYYIYYYGDGSVVKNYAVWEKFFNDKKELETVSILLITPDITESYYVTLGKKHYLEIVAEIEATR